MSNPSDTLMPKAVTDLVFDLFDSVTLSQLPDEQAKLYETDFKDLSQKYFASQPWPSPRTIASECNGDPLFMAVYRELTHRHWHAVNRPTVRDRLEGWQVYKELFEEILDNSNFYLLPSWVFDILNEFVYQFQGFCQVRSAVYASARKHGLIDAEGNRIDEASTTTTSAGLLDNWTILENSKDCWEVEAVFGFLHRLANIGWPTSENADATPAVYTYFSIFSSVSTSRLECLLGDYTACLQALTPLSTNGTYRIPKELEIPVGEVEDDDDVSRMATVRQVLTSVMGARISVAYHAGVSLLLLRRYKDAIQTLAAMCTALQRGFKTGQWRNKQQQQQQQGASEGFQYMKQYERMLSLLAVLTHICPSDGLMEESLAKAIREKHGSKLQAATSYEEWFQSPKFITVDCTLQGSVYRQQAQRFMQEMAPAAAGRTLRSYLKLYTSLPVDKLAKFHDCDDVNDFLPLLLSYKLRMRQLERVDGTSLSFEDHLVHKSALDIHYYVEGDAVHVDEAERPRRFENYFVAQITQGNDIRKDALNIDTKV